MMTSALKILSRKEVKMLHENLRKRYGFRSTLDYAFLKNNKNKIYIINKDFSKIDLRKLRINSIGLYLGELSEDGFRLSIEGTQLIGEDCSMNIMDLTDEERRQWLRGIDLDKQIENKGYIIMKHEDYLGCGKAVENKILNFIPKNRRVNIY